MTMEKNNFFFVLGALYTYIHTSFLYTFFNGHANECILRDYVIQCWMNLYFSINLLVTSAITKRIYDVVSWLRNILKWNPKKLILICCDAEVVNWYCWQIGCCCMIKAFDVYIFIVQRTIYYYPDFYDEEWRDSNSNNEITDNCSATEDKFNYQIVGIDDYITFRGLTVKSSTDLSIQILYIVKLPMLSNRFVGILMYRFVANCKDNLEPASEFTTEKKYCMFWLH